MTRRVSELCRDDIALEGGTWQRRGLTYAWVPNRPAPKADVSGLIACPTCRAKVTESCRTSSGHTTARHATRLTARLCLCGASLPGQRRLCDECRDEANRMNKRRWARRARELEEAA